MKNGNWTADASVKVLVEADPYRGNVSIQHYTGKPVSIAFGSDPEVGKGLRLSATFPLLTVNDHRARLEVRGICAATETAEGGFATA